MFGKNGKFYSTVYEYAYGNGYHKNPHYLCGASLFEQITKICHCNTFLDVGCAKGKTVEIATRKGFQATGIDICESAIREGKSLGRNIIRASAVELPFKDDSFDLVFGADIFEHLLPEDVEQSISECFRVAKKYIAVQIQNDKVVFPEPFEGLKIDKFTGPHLTKQSIGAWKRAFTKVGGNIVWARGYMFVLEI